MNITASEIKKGMTVTWGVVTLTVKEIVNGIQKNGKKTITFKGPASRSHGRGYKPSKYQNYKFTCKAQTKLNVR